MSTDVNKGDIRGRFDKAKGLHPGDIVELHFTSGERCVGYVIRSAKDSIMAALGGSMGENTEIAHHANDSHTCCSTWDTIRLVECPHKKGGAK